MPGRVSRCQHGSCGLFELQLLLGHHLLVHRQLVLDLLGKLLGRVLARRSGANIGFGGSDGKEVYLTATDRLLVFRRK